MTKDLRELFKEAMVDRIEDRIAAELVKHYPSETPVTRKDIEDLLKRDEWYDDGYEEDNTAQG
jgi:hypothetical protein